MSKLLLSAALVAGLGIAFGASAAGNGTINITGRITSASCTVTVNGSTGTTAVVLPTVQTTDLAAGATGFTAVNFAITGCSAGTDTPAITQVRPYFEQGPTTDLTTGYLSNKTGSTYAANVEVMLSSTASTAGKLDLSKGPGAQGVTAVTLPAGSSVANFTYYAAYIANGGTAGAGLVSTSVQYTLDYL